MSISLQTIFLAGCSIISWFWDNYPHPAGPVSLTKFNLFSKSAFAKIGSNYTDSMWALATASIPEEKVTKVGFIGSQRLVCICVDQSVSFYQFSPEGVINRTEVRHLDELEMSSDNW